MKPFLKRGVPFILAFGFILSGVPTGVSAQGSFADIMGLSDACAISANDVQVSLASPTTSVAAGKTFVFSGTVSNKGKSPFVDGTLVARVEKIASKTGGIYERATDLVDRIVVLDNIELARGTSRPFSFSWNVPQGLVGGTYRASFFLTSSGQFIVAGIEHNENAMAASVIFTVNGGVRETSFIDGSSLKVSGWGLGSNRFIALSAGRQADVSFNIVSNHTAEQAATLEWQIYSSEIISPDSLMTSGTKSVRMLPNKSTSASFSIPSITAPLYHVVLKLTDGSKSSLYTFRILNSSVPSAQVLALGMSAFPIVKGEKLAVFGCVSPTLNVKIPPPTTLKLSLIRADGSLFADLGTFKKGFTNSSFSRTLTPLLDESSDLTLKAEIISDKGLVEHVSAIRYSCSKMDCKTSSSVSTRSYYWITGAGIVLILLMLSMRKKRRQHTNDKNHA